MTTNSLLTKAGLGSLTIAEKLELAKLLQLEAEEEKKAKLEENINKVIGLIEELGLTKEDIVKEFQAKPVLLVSWNGYKRYSGERGKLPAWVEEFKKLGKEECLKFIVNNEPKAKVFINNLFEK